MDECPTVDCTDKVAVAGWCRRCYMRQWREANKERLQDYYHRSKEKQKAYKKERYRTDTAFRERIRTQSREYQRKKREREKE